MLGSTCKALTTAERCGCPQVWQASQDLQPIFAGIDQLVGHNLRRVQSAMQRHRVGPHHFTGSTGYGHGDLGREAFDLVRAFRGHSCTMTTAVIESVSFSSAKRHAD